MLNDLYFQQPEVAGSISWDARHPRTATQVTYVVLINIKGKLDQKRLILSLLNV